MDRSFEGSSVDPEEFEPRSNKNQPSPTSDQGNSLPSFNLEDDSGYDASPSSLAQNNYKSQQQAFSFPSRPSDGNNSQRCKQQLSESNLSKNTSDNNAQRLPDEVDDTLHQRLERVVSLDSSFAGADSGAAGVCQKDLDGGKNRMERVSSLNSSPAPAFHAVIICPEDHKEMANEMKEYLNKQKLDDGTVAKVATENDIASFGKLEVANIEELLQCANYVFLLVNETFGREFIPQVAVGDSLTTNGPKREYVIPVFMENKSCLPATLRQIKGIDLYLCHNSWKEKIIDFMLILNKACKKRKK